MTNPVSGMGEDVGLRRQLMGFKATALAAAWDAIDTAMMVVDSDTKVLLANATACADLLRSGVTPGMTMAPLPPRSSRADGTPLSETLRPLRRALAGQTVHDEEFVIAANGQDDPRRVIVSAHPFVVDTGERLALVIWRDVTSKWQFEEQRHATLGRLNRLLDGAADYAILMLDPLGHVLTWSASASRLKRYDEREVLGRPYSLFFTPQDQAAGLPQAILAEASARGRAVTDGERVRGDGTRFWARGVITAQLDANGALLGFVKVTHDVTDEHVALEEVARLNERLLTVNQQLEERITERTRELQRQASELETANQELEAFSYSVSHDLRAPLRGMSDFARLLVEDHAAQLDPQGRHYLERIETSASQMGQLIEGLLDLSRLQRHELADEPVDMHQLAKRAWEAVAEKSTKVAFDLERLPPSRGDAQLLTQVWINLIGNAVKFSRDAPAPYVKVSASTAAGRSIYAVKDNGAGFDQAHADRLFQPFQRLHRAEDFPGTGIGLALVHRIVLRHGGSITGTGVPHAGAEFRFTLGAP